MKQSVSQKVEEFLEPIVNGLGYELVEVEYAKKQNGMNLTVLIDSKDGISLSDCEKVHKAIDEPLDELDPTNNAPYTLNVSSCGLDRPFKTDKDYERNKGEMIEVSLYSKQDGKKCFVGELKDFSPEFVTILSENKDLQIERKNISKVIKYISF